MAKMLEEGALLEMEEIPDTLEGESVAPNSTGPWKSIKKLVSYATMTTLIGSVLAFLVLSKTSKSAYYENPFWPPPPTILDSSMLPTGSRLHDLTAVVQEYVPEALNHAEFVKADKNSELSLNTDNASYWMRKLKEGVDQMELSPRRNLEISICSFDAYQILITIGQIVNNIEGLKAPCGEPYPNDVNKRTTCASLVMLQISFWGFILTYVTDAVSSCPGKFNLRAGCALGVGGFLTTMDKIGATGAQISGNCKQGIAKNPPPVNPATIAPATFAGLPQDVQDRLQEQWTQFKEKQNEARADQWSWAIGGGRRLETEAIAKLPSDPLEAPQAGLAPEKSSQAREAPDRILPTTKQDVYKKRWATSACVMDTQNFGAKLAATGNFMGMSALDCKKEYFEKRGHPGKNKCAIDIGLLVGNIAIAANMIALDVINCPATLEYNPDALCAGGIIDIVARCGFLVVAFAGIQDSCGSLDTD